MKLTQHFSSSFITNLVQSRITLLVLILIQIFMFSGPNFLSITDYYPSAVVNSVDGPTHQMFGEIYTQKLKEGGIKNLLTNRVPEIGYNARFPDKYPPLFHILCSIISIVLKIPWIASCIMILFVCFFYLLYEIQKWFQYLVGSYQENLYLSWFFWITISAVIFSDYSMPEKGISYFSVTTVGLYAQLLFTCLFSTFIRYITHPSFKWIELMASIFFLCLCYWSNILAFPLSLCVFLYIAYKYKLTQLKRYLPFIIAFLCITPWLIPFTKTTTFSPSKMKIMALYHYVEHSLIYIYSLIILSFLWLGRFQYKTFWTLTFLFLTQCIFWTLSHDFFRNFESLNLLTNLPIQFSRYWPYVIISIFFALSLELKQKLKNINFNFSPLSLGMVLLVINTIVFSTNYNSLVVNRHYHTENKSIIQDIYKFQYNNPAYNKKIFMVPTFNDNWLARTVASDLKVQAVRKNIKIDFNGYHENSVIQQLIEPVRNQLLQEKPGGLFYIPKYHNDLLYESLGVEGYIEVLNEFNIGIIACPTKATRGFCSYLINKHHPLEIISNSYWWTVYAIPFVHQNYRTPILLYADLGAKVRNSLSDMKFVTFYENILFSNKISSYKLYYLHPNFNDESIACSLEYINAHNGVIITPSMYEKRITSILKSKKLNIKLITDDESQNGLQQLNLTKNLNQSWIEQLPEYNVFDETNFNIDKNNTLQIIETPFFKKNILCHQ
ncbi:MAG TPA: hypothetical protein PKC21_10175 [Oligoflexia bacterium]|nr:hypothetical protein [Oligoflexia bacterium]HMR25706.1 hypothetical protein [Oligoflexia bacterium]